MTDNEDRIPKVEEISPTEAPNSKDGLGQATLKRLAAVVEKILPPGGATAAGESDFGPCKR